MAKLTPNQLKAIGWYAEKHGLRLALSVPPVIVFKKGNGIVQRDVLTLVALWQRDRKEKKKLRKES